MSEQYQYLNVVLQNNTNNAIPAILNETKTSPILQDQENWKLSVVRFKLPLYNIPLFKFNTTPDFYQLTLKFESANPGTSWTSTQSVQFLEDDGVHLNTPDSNKNIYYYSQFINMVNYAFLLAYQDLQVHVNGIHAINLDHFTNAPQIQYDPVTKLFILVLPIENVGNANPHLESVYDIDNSIFGPPPAPGAPFADPYHRVTISFNNHLFNFFNGFPALRIDNGNMNYSYQLQIYQNKGDLVAGDYFNEEDQPEKYLLFKADYPCLYSWHRLSRILFLTNMQIAEESVSTNSLGFINQPNRLSILTDFEIPMSDQSNREYLFFMPSILRYTNITGMGPLRQVSISVFYEDLDNNYIPLTIPPNSDIYVKIQFSRLKSIILYKPSEIALEEARKLK